MKYCVTQSPAEGTLCPAGLSVYLAQLLKQGIKRRLIWGCTPKPRKKHPGALSKHQADRHATCQAKG
jgi:hypothetical protein